MGLLASEVTALKEKDALCHYPGSQREETLQLTVIPCSDPQPRKGIVIVTVPLAARKRNPLKLP